MLQSLSGKLNRLNDVREIGMTIANELRQLIDYHNCRVLLLEDDRLLPIAFRGELTGEQSAVMDVLVRQRRRGSHRPRRRDGQAADHRRRRQLRVRRPDRGHGGDRGVADRRSAHATERASSG